MSEDDRLIGRLEAFGLSVRAAPAMHVSRSHFAVLQYRALAALRRQLEGGRDV